MPKREHSIEAIVAGMDPQVAARLLAAVDAQPLAKPKAKPLTEHQEQARLISMCDKHPVARLIFAIPNGTYTTVAMRAKAKAEGRKPGVPDLFLPVPRPIGWDEGCIRFCPGLFIELKRTRGGTVAPEQKEWHEKLRAQGYRVEICKGCDEAWSVIMDYLGGG